MTSGLDKRVFHIFFPHVARRLSIVAAALVASCVSIAAAHENARAPVTVTCEEPSRLFMGTEVPKFKIKGESPASQPTWRVDDWRGEDICRGALAADGHLELPGLPPGYWLLRIEGAEPLSFVTTIDPSLRRRVAESPFAADSAFSWMDIPSAFSPSFQGNYSAHLARLLRAAGITQTRERIYWGAVQKELGGAFNWGKYLRNAQLLGANGIKISWMNAGAPKFAGGAGGGWGTQSLARDLVAVRDFCDEAGRAFGPYLANFEYLNEPDLMLPAWDATAQFKAASAGFRASRSGIPVANFSMCLGVDYAYDNLVFDNDLAPYIDIFNIHHYGKLSEYDAFDARIHRFLEKRGLADMPILVTESGCESEGEATFPTDSPRHKAQSPEQEMIVADFIPKAQIKRQFGGVWRNHFFIFASFHERGGRKDWGLVRRDGSARPGVAAFAALTDALDGARMLGRADAGPGVEAYLYERDDGRRVLAFWATASNKSQAARSSANGPPALTQVEARGALALRDWCGTPRPLPACFGGVNPPGEPIPAEKHVSYLIGDFDIPLAAPAATAGILRVRSPEDFPGIDLSTIIRVDFPPEEFDIVDGFSAAETKRAGKGRVKIEIWNLDPWPKRGRLFSEGGDLDGWPEGEIELPPRGVFAHEAVLVPHVGADGEAAWRLRGDFNGRSTTAFVAPVRDFASALAGMRRFTVDAADQTNWRKNTSAPKATFSPDGDAMRIDLSWVGAAPTPDGRWAYNGIRVPEEARRSLKYVVFEIRSEQDKIENNYSTANVFTLRRGGASDRIPCSAPAKEWTKIHVAIPRGDREVEWVGVGGNPAGKEVTMWVRNIEFFCPGN